MYLPNDILLLCQMVYSIQVFKQWGVIDCATMYCIGNFQIVLYKQIQWKAGRDSDGS